MGSIQIIVGWVLSQEIVNSAPVGIERVMPAVIYGLNGGLLSQKVSAAVLTRQGKLKDAFHCHVGHCHNLHHAPRMTRHGAVSPPLVDFLHLRPLVPFRWLNVPLAPSRRLKLGIRNRYIAQLASSCRSFSSDPRLSLICPIPRPRRSRPVLRSRLRGYTHLSSLRPTSRLSRRLGRSRRPRRVPPCLFVV